MVDSYRERVGSRDDALAEKTAAVRSFSARFNVFARIRLEAARDRFRTISASLVCDMCHAIASEQSSRTFTISYWLPVFVSHGLRLRSRRTAFSLQPWKFLGMVIISFFIFTLCYLPASSPSIFRVFQNDFYRVASRSFYKWCVLEMGAIVAQVLGSFYIPTMPRFGSLLRRATIAYIYYI